MIFSLISGAENIFAIAEPPLDAELDEKELVAKAVTQSISIVLDGVVFLYKTDDHSYRWSFYNRDGSIAEMCGNAARCVGALNYKNTSEVKMKLSTLAGDVMVEIHNKEVWVHMPLVQDLGIKHFPEINKEFLVINSGVPHVVCVASDRIDIEEVKKIRKSLVSGARGANVTIVTKYNDLEKICAVTFERGVEDFTKACGTGAVAAAYWRVRHDLGKQSGDILVEMPGGNLRVRVDGNKIQLTGPVKFLGKLEIR